MPLHVVVRGRVQGVGFRWFVRAEAHALGLRGWVKNRADGGVEVAADGPEDALSALRARLRQGPPHAQVSGLDEQDAVAGDLPNPFDILR